MPRAKTVKERMDEGFAKIAKEGVTEEEGRNALASLGVDPNVVKGCQEAGLDPMDLGHCAVLLKQFAAARYGRTPAQVKWHPARLSSLYLQYLRRMEPALSDEEICTAIIKEVKHFSGDAPATLRKRLYSAWDPRKNEWHAHVCATWPERVQEHELRRASSALS